MRSIGLLLLVAGCGSSTEPPPLSLEQLEGNWYSVNAEGAGNASAAVPLKFLLGPRSTDTSYCDSTKITMELFGEVLAVSGSCFCIRTFGNPGCTGMPPPSYPVTIRYRGSLLAEDLFVSTAGSAGRGDNGTIWIAGTTLDFVPWSVDLAPDGSAIKDNNAADTELRWRDGFGRGKVLFRLDSSGQPHFDSDIFLDSDEEPTIGGRGAYVRAR